MSEHYYDCSLTDQTLREILDELRAWRVEASQSKAAPKPSEPDALLMARLKAAEDLCVYTAARERSVPPNYENRLVDYWLAAKSAHEALPGAGGAT